MALNIVDLGLLVTKINTYMYKHPTNYYISHYNSFCSKIQSYSISYLGLLFRISYYCASMCGGVGWVGLTWGWPWGGGA